MPQKITAVISETEFEQNFGFKETSGLYQDPNFRLVINKLVDAIGFLHTTTCKDLDLAETMFIIRETIQD